MLFAFTFITMVGGNPQGDAYGFRYWYSPGAFNEYIGSGALGRFEGFLAGMWSACFAIVGPEYISMVSAEAQRPRIYIRNAFKVVYVRFLIFFVGSALCVGIVVAYNDPTLTQVVEGGESSAAASPYVIAMNNMGIEVLPHIVNALMLTSIFSAGNTYVYCSTRSLYGLALEGRAPAILRTTLKSGVPIYCFFIVMLFPFLALLQVSSSSAEVLEWLVALFTAGGIINYLVMSTTFLFYYRACKAQGFDRNKLAYTGWFQPYGAWFALIFQFAVVMVYNNEAFRPWSVEAFFKGYTMQIVAPILYFGWKLIKKTKIKKAHEVDLVWEAPIIDAYEASITTPPDHFWPEMARLFGLGFLLKLKKKPATA
jgi:amino acid transporter